MTLRTRFANTQLKQELISKPTILRWILSKLADFGSGYAKSARMPYSWHQQMQVYRQLTDRRHGHPFKLNLFRMDAPLEARALFLSLKLTGVEIHFFFVADQSAAPLCLNDNDKSQD
jgi:hypothetical protein